MFRQAELLQLRTMLSSVTFDTGSNMLDISLEGSDGVSAEVVNDKIEVSINGSPTTPTPNVSDVHFINVTGGSGDNLIDLSSLSAADFSYLLTSTSINGGDGNDTIYGSGIMDDIHGDAGNDSIDGGYGSDNIWGDEGADVLNGGVDSDCVMGGDGDDTLWSGNGAPDDSFGLDGECGLDMLDGVMDESDECGSGGSGNTAPVANAGGTESPNGGRQYDVDFKTDLSLDGSMSYDSDGDTLTFRWDLNSDGLWDLTGQSPTVSWDDLTGSLFSFNPGDVIVATLQVNDSNGGADVDTVGVTLHKPLISITVDDAVASEGYDGDFETASVTISRTNTSLADPLTVAVQTSGTAITDIDYNASPGNWNWGPSTVVIPANEDSLTITITPVQDSDYLEPVELINLTVVPLTTYWTTSQIMVTVTLNPGNRSPIVPSASYTIAKQYRGAIANVNASDPDDGQTLTYSLNGFTDIFAVTSSGDVIVSDPSALSEVTSGTTFALVVTATDNGIPAESGSGTVAVTVKGVGVTLRSVNFLDNHTVWRDPEIQNPGILQTITSTAYEKSPEWIADNNGNVSRNTPLAYTSFVEDNDNDTLKASPYFTVHENWSHTDVSVRALVAHGFNMPAETLEHTEYTSTNDSLWLPTGVALEASAEFARPLYDDKFTIRWQISLDSGTSWIGVRSTDHRMYVTWKLPEVTKLWETLLHIGTINATGASSEESVVSRIWDEFPDLSVSRVDGLVMEYSHEKVIPGVIFDGVPDETVELLAYGKGQCNSWTDFFEDVLLAQGVSLTIQQRKISAVVGTGFIVESHWQWEEPQEFADAPEDFNYLQNENIWDGIGAELDGQGYSNGMKADFKNHWIIQINGKIYDPSYGGFFNTLAEWEEAAVVGATVDGPSDPDGGSRFYSRKRESGDTFTTF